MIKKSIISGFLGGFVASMCCLGPTLIVLVGLGAFFGISGLCFADLRIYFIAAGLIVFGIATGLYMTRDKIVCSLDNKKKTIFVLVSIAVMVITYSLILFFVVPYLQAPISAHSTCSI